MFNYVDVAICLIIFISVGIGIYKGFVKEVFSLVGLIVALVVAFYLSDYPVQWLMPTSQNWGGEWLGLQIEGESIVFVISFILIFLIALVIGKLLTNALSEAVSKTAILSSMDRVLGAVFGFLRGAVLVILVVMLAGLTKVSIYSWWQQSQLLPPFIEGAQRIVALLPVQYSWHFDFGLPAIRDDNPTQLKPLPKSDTKEQII